jgi:hypothetical protein
MPRGHRGDQARVQPAGQQCSNRHVANQPQAYRLVELSLNLVHDLIGGLAGIGADDRFDAVDASEVAGHQLYNAFDQRLGRDRVSVR